jgi:hypothetical protein
MKAVVYITKNKIWVNEQVYEWDGVSMDKVFGKIKKELKADEVRIVLGNDVSFVTAVKANDTFLNRESVYKMAESWVPFKIDNDCFDWKQVTLGHDEVWIQIVAMEKSLLLSLNEAIQKSGVRVSLVTAIGIMLGEKSREREAPVVIKWMGKESLLVLAVNGLVDLVVSEIKEEDLMVYASKRWGLAVNPEQIMPGERDFNLFETVFSEKSQGEDSRVLNLPIFEGLVARGGAEETKKDSWAWVWVLMIIIVVVLGMVIFLGR